MNGIEKITGRITAEAEAEALAVIQEAEKAAAAVSESYAAQARAEYEAQMQKGTREIQQNAGRADRGARLDAKKDILAVKQELMAAAYARAQEKFLAMPEENYVAFLAAQAGGSAVSGTEELIFSAADKARVGEKVAAAANELCAKRGIQAGLKVAEETRAIAGGLILKQGNVEVNCTVESLLEISHNRLDAEVAGILFN